jgi:Holliday junction resolvase RusA-like endonuclease
MKIKLDLPISPSVNLAYINLPGRGRAKSKIYKAWAKAAGWEVRVQNPKPVTGDYKVCLLMHRPNARSDVDNRTKPVLDLLVGLGVTPDDSRATEVVAKWDETVASGRMIVIIDSVGVALSSTTK